MRPDLRLSVFPANYWTNRIAFAVLFVVCCGLIVSGTAQVRPQSAAIDTNSLRSFLADYLRKSAVEDGRSTKYVAVPVKVGGDGKQVIVYITDQRWCGSGGCTTLILAHDGASYRVITKVTITQLPIRILATRTHGWRDIGVQVQGGGILIGYEAVLPYNGTSYPANPSTPPARRFTGKSRGVTVIPPTSGRTAIYP
jgi:hypothetical protein